MGTGLATAAKNLNATVKTSQTDGMIIRVYLTAVRTQQDISTEYAPNLPATQQQARDNADFWDSTVWPSMTQTVTDLLSFSNAWNNYSTLMTGYAQTISSTSNTPEQKDEARRHLDALLGQIYGDVNLKYQNTQKAFDNLKKFYDTIVDTNAQFDKELRALQDKFAGKTGVIAQLDGEIADLQDNIGKDIALLVGAIVTTIVGVGLIVVGAAVTFTTAGLSASLIVAGVTTTAASIGVLGGAAADIDKKTKDIAKLVTERAEDEAMYAAVKMMIAQVASLDAKCEAARNSTNDLMTYWTDLRGEIETLRADIKATKPGDFSVLSSIAEANADFELIKKTCADIQTAYSGGNPPIRNEQVQP